MTQDYRDFHEAISRSFSRGKFADQTCWQAVRDRNEWAEATVLARAARGEPPFAEREPFAAARLGREAESAAQTLIGLCAIAGMANEVTLQIPEMLNERDVDSWTHRHGLSELMLLNVIEYSYDKSSGALAVRVRDVKRKVFSKSVPSSLVSRPDR